MRNLTFFSSFIGFFQTNAGKFITLCVTDSKETLNFFEEEINQES